MNRDEFMENAPASWDAVWRDEAAAKASQHAAEQQQEAAAARTPMSPLGEMANASAESYAQGVAEGRRQSAKRIEHLEAALEEVLEYFEDRYDVVDGDYGEPRGNREMQMGQMIEEAIMGRRP